MLDVANGDANDVLLQTLAKGALEGLELFVDQDVEDDALEVGFKAPFCEVHKGQLVEMQTPGERRRTASNVALRALLGALGFPARGCSQCGNGRLPWSVALGKSPFPRCRCRRRRCP